jgi:hypothetical protein
MNNITSPDMSDNGVEARIQAKGKNAPRITPADVEANIASEHYFTGTDGIIGVNSMRAIRGESLGGTPPPPPLRLITFCVLVLQNGFTVTGESACASPENFDPEIGRKIARANAVAKIWPLLGFALKERLHVEGFNGAQGDPGY